MAEPLLVVEGLTRHFGGVRAVDGVDLAAAPGEVTGLIGPNGAGKTTLVNLLTGLVAAEAGSVRLDGTELVGLPARKVAALGVARTFQNIRLYKGLSVTENVIGGGHLHRSGDLVPGLLGLGSARRGAADRAAHAAELLEFVGLDPGVGTRSAGILSYGDQRRVEIARALALEPRLLVLDEPAAGMNTREKERLSELLGVLAGRGMAVLLIDHDLRLVLGLCRQIVVLDFGRRIAGGPPGQVAEDPAVVAAYLGTRAAGEGRPVVAAAPAPTTRSTAAEPLLRVEDLEVSYGPVRAVRGVSLSIHPGETVALIGANGAGKSTTLRALSGLLRPRSGTAVFDGLDLTRASSSRIVRHGLVQVPEGREVLGRLTVRENLSLGCYVRRDRRAAEREIDQHLERFPILGERADLPAGQLSGGEQQILVIVRALLAKPRLLVLDEPSLGLAPRLAEAVFDLVRDIAASGNTVLLVEQNAFRALELADRGYVIETGRVVLEGAAADLVENPLVQSSYLGT